AAALYTLSLHDALPISDAAEIGVDGLMVLPAMAYRADRREAVAHFRAVAAASPLPILCYNNPKVYGVDLTPDVFVELADVETIVDRKSTRLNSSHVKIS